MALVNRDKDPSEQLRCLLSVHAISVGASAASTFHICEVPFPGVLRAVAVAANSISGSPVLSIGVKRFTATGVTTISYVGSTLAIVAAGISSYSGQLVGLTANFALQTGDVIVAQSEFNGGNNAASSTVITAVVRATQDIVATFGLTS